MIWELTIVGIVSLTITFFNKAVFSSYNFDAANTLTFGQMFFSIIFLEVLRFFNVLQYESFKWETGKKVIYFCNIRKKEGR